MPKRKRSWLREHQSLWESVMPPLTGLKRCEWLTLKEYEKVVSILQKAIENKSEDIL